MMLQEIQNQLLQLPAGDRYSTAEEARNNLIEALKLFFEGADPSEIESRLHSEVFVTSLEVTVE